MSRRSGRNASKKLDTLTENDSGPDSPNVDMEDLSIEEQKKTRKSRALKTLKAKQDENSKFMSDFDPSLSRKAKLKISDKTYKPPVPDKPKKSSVYDNKGILISHGLDLCDCLIEECPGCHFPCPRCRSTKCGHECRNNRKWVYDSVELDGMPNTLKENKFKGKA